MNNISSPWQQIITNFIVYIVALVLVIAAFTFFKLPVLFALMWFVGLGGFLLLVYQIHRLTVSSEREFIHAEAKMQKYMKDALDYKKRIDKAIKSGRKGDAATHREHLKNQVDIWTDSITTLIERVNDLKQDPLIHQDIKSVPNAIIDLEKKLAVEKDSIVRSQLQRTLDNRRKQLEALEDLKNIIRRAEFQIESTLSMLGTIYSQLLTSQSTSEVGRYHRLSADIDEEVSQLEDHLEAIREVRLSGDL